MIKRSSSRSSFSRKSTARQRNARHGISRQFPNLALIRAHSLNISDAVMQIKADDLRDMRYRPDCERAADLLREFARYAPSDAVYACAVELILQFPNNGLRAAVLRALTPVLEAAEKETEAEKNYYALFT